MDMTTRKTFAGRKYLSFLLNDEEYCIDIQRVKEIMGITEITGIPQTPAFIKGVINLRGKIIPIIDLRVKFEMEAVEYNNRTCIIVVELLYEQEQTLMGIIVDTIQEVITIPEEKISQVPYINANIKAEYINGIAEVGSGIKIILDIVQVLTEEEFVLVRELDKGNRTGNNNKEEINV